MRFGTWNVSSLYRTGSLTAAAARELARYKLDLVGAQEVRMIIVPLKGWKVSNICEP
jgi:hypothetical protein